MSLVDLDALIQRVNLVATDFFSDPTRPSSSTQLEDVLHVRFTIRKLFHGNVLFYFRVLCEILLRSIRQDG